MFKTTITTTKPIRAGFTLIELLVVIAISAMVIGGAIAGYITFENRRRTETQTQQLQQMILSARSKASARVTPDNYFNEGACRNENNRRLIGYRVRLDAVNDRITVQPRCENGVANNQGTDTFTLANLDMTLSGTGDFTFYTVPQNGVLTSLSGNTTITVEGGGLTCSFTVTEAGGVTRVNCV
ncbi:MAG: prepilin-type N-terminal cleavage/methylation domain-containing protein [Patescibacteria group bacterium]